MRKQTIFAEVDPNLKSEFKIICEMQGLKIKWVIEQLIHEFINKNKNGESDEQGRMGVL